MIAQTQATTKQLENSTDRIIDGVNKTVDVISSTMGGRGRNVIISTNDYMEPLKFTKDGVSVAKAIRLDDRLENIGTQLVISAANETVNSCGDGTTLTSLLLKSFVNYLREYISKNNNFNETFDELEKIKEFVSNEIDSLSNKVRTYDEVKHVATISAKSKRIGDLFKNIYAEVGFDSNIIVEKSEDSVLTDYDILKGFEFEVSGYIHSSFMTNKDTEQAVYENAYVHIDENPISVATEEYLKMLQACKDNSIPLIIVAPKFSDSFMRLCSMNKVNNGYPVCLVKTPGYGYGKTKSSDDIRSVLGEDGYVDKVVIDPYRFIIYNEDTPNLKARLKSLKSLADNAVEFYDKTDYLNRYHKMNNSFAVIFAGGKTEEEQSEEFDRLEDAVGAVTSAIAEGYVYGAGYTFYKISEKLGDSELENIVKDILRSPFRQIFLNANNPDIKFDSAGPIDTSNFKVNTNIYDPAKVLKESFANAIANAKLLLNTSYTLNNEYGKGI